MTVNRFRNWFIFAASSVVLASTAFAAPAIKNVVLVHGAFVDGSGWQPVYDILTKDGYHVTLVHQVRDWFSGAAAYFGWMREAKRENTRCGLRPMSDKAASQKTRSLEGCDENGPAAALLLSHVSIQTCSFVAPCRRPILIATPLNQSRTWCTSSGTAYFFGGRCSRYPPGPRSPGWSDHPGCS